VPNYCIHQAGRAASGPDRAKSVEARPAGDACVRPRVASDNACAFSERMSPVRPRVAYSMVVLLRSGMRPEPGLFMNSLLQGPDPPSVGARSGRAVLLASHAHLTLSRRGT
jgi:hypothetical protein